MRTYPKHTVPVNCLNMNGRYTVMNVTPEQLRKMPKIERVYIPQYPSVEYAAANPFHPHYSYLKSAGAQEDSRTDQEIHAPRLLVGSFLRDDVSTCERGR